MEESELFNVREGPFIVERQERGKEICGFLDGSRRFRNDDKRVFISSQTIITGEGEIKRYPLEEAEGYIEAVILLAKKTDVKNWQCHSYGAADLFI